MACYQGVLRQFDACAKRPLAGYPARKQKAVLVLQWFQFAA
jgi:hypothetical protein